MNLSQHFTLAEFTASETASRQQLDNQVPPGLMDAARETCQLLERIRSHLGRLANRNVPIIITSGYRSLAVNRAIGSGDSSDHPRAAAADFQAPAFGTPYEVCQALAPHISTLGIGQLIHEFRGWTHVSTRTPDRPANRLLTIDGRGTRVGIQP